MFRKITKELEQNLSITLPNKCPYSELFWSAFSCIKIQYGVPLRIQSECEKMRTRVTPNTDTFHEVLFAWIPNNFYPYSGKCIIL